MNKLLVLYANCIPVGGASRAALYDLQRGRVHLIPNSLHVLFDENACLDFDGISRRLENSEQRLVLEEYKDWLLGEELAFLATEAEAAHYPRLSRQWLFPALISNCLIDIDADTDTAYLATDLWLQLETLYCNHIQLRCFDRVDHHWLEQLLHSIYQSQVKTVSLVLAFKEEPEFFSWLDRLVTQNIKVQSVLIHSCTADVQPLALQDGRCIQATAQKLTALHCGIVSTDYFAINIPAYTESLQHNSCLNRKISIDARGYIKNCPSMAESFGHIRYTTLREAFRHPGFKKYWDISKDQVAVCRDCEFRYICTDCRAYVEEPGNDTSKPLKCGYDPYTATWQEWSSSPLKQEVMQFYGIPY